MITSFVSKIICLYLAAAAIILSSLYMLIVFSGNTSWGMFNFRMGVMKHFMMLGYQVCVIAPEDDYTSELVAAGIGFTPIHHLHKSGINPVQDFALYREYKAIYKKLQPGFVFHYTAKPNIYGSLAAKAAGISCISITTGLGRAFSGRGLLFRFAKFLYRLSSQHATEVWFLNESDKAVFIRNKIIPERKAVLLPGEGVNTSKFKSGHRYPEHKNTHFLLIARMLYDKGIEVFVEAIQHLQKKGYAITAQLLGPLAADNPQAINSATLAAWQQAGILTYLGSTTDVRPYLEQANAVVLPSYYKEGIPMVLLEAASMCRPIITTYNPGCAEVVDDQVNGFLCNSRDAIDLAQKMEQFILLPQDAKRKMGLAGREKVLALYDEEKIIGIYAKRLGQYIAKAPVGKTTSQ